MLNNRLLNDRYRVQEMIGGGGMANVYLAHDTILDRAVAIKVLRLEHGNDEEFIARFHREAQSATSLSHPNIVNIYDVGEEDDIYFMVMEYVDGMTLKQYIQQHSPVDVTEAVDIMRQIASAISHAHDNDIVHRDIKPQNILIDHYGHVKVTDFGIAMALSATALTQTNSVLGSVHYLSPEQARGGMATKKSDVYSLGIVFFELLTGRLPFSGESPVSIALKHLQHETPSPRRWNADLPQSVENIVLKSTAKDPFHRFESVLEMENDIETSLEPYRANEPAFTLPDDEEDEKTKAIPVITNESYGDSPDEDTIINTNDHKPLSGASSTQTKTFQESKQEGQVAKGKEKKKRRFWPWILSLLLLLIIGGAVALFTIPGIIQPADVDIPDLSGEEYEAAYSQLSDLKLNVVRETRFSEEVEEGDVIETDPEAGMTVKEGSEVTVYLSSGREQVVFPDYTGEEYERVKEELESKGYGEIRSYPTSSDRPAGEILEHVTPSPGDNVIPEDTNVSFQVSSGPPTFELSNLEGVTEQNARDYLERRGLGVQVSYDYSGGVGEGRVISQDPGAFTEVEEGETVTLVVSKGPEPQPPREETREIEVPYEAPPDESEQTDEDEQEEPTEPTEPEGQQVLIYVNDADTDDSTPVIDEVITETKTYNVTFTIEPNSKATYRVLRDGEVIDEGEVSY